MCPLLHLSSNLHFEKYICVKYLYTGKYVSRVVFDTIINLCNVSPQHE